MSNYKNKGVLFWKKDSGNHMTHSQGLSEDQIAFFHSLKRGDRLIAFANNRGNKETDYSFNLTVSKPKEDSEDII